MNKKEVEELYKYLGMNKRKLDTWDFNILTSYEGFETPFGRKSTKNRKLYNGKLKCYYYQYFDNEKNSLTDFTNLCAESDDSPLPGDIYIHITSGRLYSFLKIDRKKSEINNYTDGEWNKI